jgi:hypothetical protein
VQPRRDCGGGLEGATAVGDGLRGSRRGEMEWAATVGVGEERWRGSGARATERGLR